MKKKINTYIFVAIAVIALYLTTIKYRNYSLDKSISACVIAQIKKTKDMSIDDAKKYCEKEIKK